MSYFDPHQPRPLEPLVAVFRVLGERFDTLEAQARIERELRQSAEANSQTHYREIEEGRRRTVGVEAERDRWRDRALEAEQALREPTLPPDVVAVIDAARAAAEDPTNYRLGKLRRAFRELDREETP